MKNQPLPRFDQSPELRERLMPYCRLARGETWTDPVAGHRVGCLDAADSLAVARLLADDRVELAVHDPPYNLIAFEQRALEDYIAWCERWVSNTVACLADDSALYVWLGADQNHGFQPLPDFMLMMRRVQGLAPRSFITLRNQRGYGTPHNWMAVRQELLYYVHGKPAFTVQYTDIPKILRGYYKDVDGRRTENLQRGKSEHIRPGNVWVDVQQVFYRLEENVSGCYAQKPLKAIERIVAASSREDDNVLDLFAHAGTTLLACERLGRRCLTADIDPVYCEISIRRLEQYRAKGRTGWQNGHAFERELGDCLNAPIQDGDAPAERNGVCQGSLF